MICDDASIIHATQLNHFHALQNVALQRDSQIVIVKVISCDDEPVNMSIER